MDVQALGKSFLNSLERRGCFSGLLVAQYKAYIPFFHHISQKPCWQASIIVEMISWIYSPIQSKGPTCMDVSMSLMQHVVQMKISLSNCETSFKRLYVMSRKQAASERHKMPYS